MGESFSTARMIKTNNAIESIRVGDIVYSPGWSPDSPTRFALIGMMDVNRDGKDDRDELKRMIQEAGGLIDFDLPPPDVGQETGTLLPRIDWYVIDDRTCQQPSSRSEWARSSRKRGSAGSDLCRSDGCSPSWAMA